MTFELNNGMTGPSVGFDLVGFSGPTGIPERLDGGTGALAWTGTSSFSGPSGTSFAGFSGVSGTPYRETE